MAAETKNGEQVGSKEFLIDLAKGGPLAAIVGFLGWFLTSQMESVSSDIASLRNEIQAMQVAAALGSADRWSAGDQRAFTRELDAQLRDLERRVETLEKERIQ